MSTPQERAQAFFDSVPEPEGTLDEIIERAEREQWERLQAKWASG